MVLLIYSHYTIDWHLLHKVEVKIEILPISYSAFTIYQDEYNDAF